MEKRTLTVRKQDLCQQENNFICQGLLNTSDGNDELVHPLPSPAPLSQMPALQFTYLLTVLMYSNWGFLLASDLDPSIQHLLACTVDRYQYPERPYPLRGKKQEAQINHLSRDNLWPGAETEKRTSVWKRLKHHRRLYIMSSLCHSAVCIRKSDSENPNGRIDSSPASKNPSSSLFLKVGIGFLT